MDDSFRPACHRFLLGRYIAEDGTRITVMVGDGHSRFKVVFGSGARINLPATGRYAAVTATFYGVREVVDVLFVQ